MLKKKDGEMNLHFASCPHEVQAGLRETRRVEWKKWTSFNAGVSLTDEQVRQLTDAGCEICPMQWVDTDKIAHLRRDKDYVSVPAKYKSRLVGCGNFDSTEGRRTDSPAGDVDSHNIVCSWYAQAHVSIHSCDFTNGHFQGQEIDRILLYRIPAEGIPEEGIAGGEILASRVPVYGTKDAGRALWLRLKNTCKQFKFTLNQILPTLFTLRDDESRIIAVMSSNVDDLLYGYLPEGAEAMNSVLQQCLVGTFSFCVYSRRNTSIEIRHTVSCLGCKTRHVLTFHAVFRRFEARLKMLMSETCVSAIALWSTQHLHPHLTFSSLQLFLGMMRLLRRSVTPVSAKNRSKHVWCPSCGCAKSTTRRTVLGLQDFPKLSWFQNIAQRLRRVASFFPCLTKFRDGQLRVLRVFETF